ncbi:methyltransferase family protein [Octadecabacter ascidiaceicola]|nr:methyltransferase [Octadecabacter ascidiaceicola]
MMETNLVILGLTIAFSTLAAILWSIFCPTRRLWPPQKYTALTPVLVWVPTFTLFAVLVILGILGWQAVAFPNWVRLGIGVPFIILGHLGVWSEVMKFGVPQTGGAVGELKTDGLYRFSRNPQYVADIAMVAGWLILSAAPSAMIVGAVAIAVLIAAPFAEEPWLEANYGQAYKNYRLRVRRFL